MRLALAVLWLINFESALARTMDSQEPIRARFGWELERRDQSDGDAKGFINWSLSGEVPFFHYLSGIGSLQYAPDTHKDTGEFSVYQNHLKVGAGLGVYYNFWLRWFLETQGVLIQEQLVYKTGTEKESISTQLIGVQSRLGFDYLMSKSIEVRLSYGIQNRGADRRLDSLKGLFVTYRF